MSLFWIGAGFLSGSLPFSIWIGRLALGVDIRAYGDGNPGAFNVFRAGGKAWGWLAILLDFFKGAAPVYLAREIGGLAGWGLVLAAAAPVAGHAWSPFLGLHGGRALAVTFGIWSGLTLWVAPVILGAFFTVLRLLLKEDRWTVLLGQLGLLAGLAFLQAEWTWYAVWVGSVAVYVIKDLDGSLMTLIRFDPD